MSRYRLWRGVLVALALVAWISGGAEAQVNDGAPLSRDELSRQLVVTPDPAGQLQTLNLIARQPLSDNDVIVPWLRANADRLEPIFLYELARRVFPDNHAEALDWYAVALVRARYDANRCTDPSAGRDIGLLAWRADPVPGYAQSHPDELSAAFRRVQSRSDLFVNQISPLWICQHGIKAFSSPANGQSTGSDRVKPESEWPRIREILQSELDRLPIALNARPLLLKSGRVIEQLVHQTDVDTVAWSPDDRLLATASALDRNIALWDVASGRVLHEMKRDLISGRSLAFTSDGQWLLTSRAHLLRSDNTTVNLWDVRTGELTGKIGGPFDRKEGDGNQAGVFSLDSEGQVLAVAALGGRVGSPVALYDMRTFTLIGTVAVDHDIPTALAVAPGGARVAFGTAGGLIALVDVKSRKVLWTADAYGQFGATVKSLAFSPNGQLIGSGPSGQSHMRRARDGTLQTVPQLADPVRVWKAKDGSPAYSFPMAAEEVNDLSWSPDNRVLACANSNGTVALLNIEGTKAITPLANFSVPAMSVAFDHAGRRVAASAGNVVVIIAVNRSAQD